MSDKTIDVIVRNVSKGPKVLNSRPAGLLAAGDSTDTPVTMTEAEYEIAKGTGWFEFDGASEEGLSGMTVPELKALAEAESIDLGDATKKADIISAIELAREG